ncbi:MAG: hypothetical protein AABX04_05360 [Nanoarchaeota archaeon]
MRAEEYFHTGEQYLSGGISPVVEHAKAYFKGNRTLPVSKTKLETGLEGLIFTFSDVLLRKMVSDTASLEKPYEVAIKYGFRGYSLGGKNGVFYQRNEDVGLLRATEKLIRVCQPQIVTDLQINASQLADLKKVKIVWHNPCGERIVGVYNTTNSRILFLDFACY